MSSTPSVTSGAALAASIAADTLAGLGAAVGSALATAASGAAAGAPAARTARTGGAAVLSPRSAASPAGKALSTGSARRTTTARRGTSASRKPAASRTTGYASASGTTKAADLAFLRDPKLSIEEKLFRFLLLVAKQTDQELVAKMEEMKGKAARTSTGGGSTSAAGAAGGAPPTPAPARSKKKGFSLWSAAKLIMPQLGIASKLLGDSTVKGLVQQLTGPVLAAGATALGMPYLAPVALQVGPQLAAFVTDEGQRGVSDPTATSGSPGSGSASGASGSSGGGSSGTSGSNGSPGSASASSGGTGVSEQVQVMELQRLIDKQKEMFSLVSNILRTMHDTRMTAINNIR
jgi:hypothetical protein